MKFLDSLNERCNEKAIVCPMVDCDFFDLKTTMTMMKRMMMKTMKKKTKNSVDCRY